MSDLGSQVFRCGPGQVPSAAEVESLYHAYGHGWRWAEQTGDWADQLKERLAGAAGGLDGRFAVYLLAVHPWHRRAGLGRQLLQTLLSATNTGAWLITRDEPTPAMA